MGSRPDQFEEAALLKLLNRDRDEFRKMPDSATKLSQIGLSPNDEAVDSVEVAAWTSVSRALLNLSETYSRE